MPLFTFTGSAVVTSLAAPIAAADLTLTLGSGTGWPEPTGTEVSVATLGDPENGNTEEKILFTQRVGENITISQRGYDDTPAQDWPQGTRIRHTISAVFANESSLHVHDTSRNDHTQYLLTSDHAVLQHTDAMLATDSVGSDELKANAVETANILDSAVTTGKVADLAITDAKLAASAVTPAKIAADAIDDPTKFAAGVRPVRAAATEPATDLQTGDVWVDTDAGNRIHTYDGSAFAPTPMQLIEAKTLVGVEQNINFTGIPDSFSQLRLVLWGISHTGGDTVRSVEMRFNNDSAANYQSQVNRDGTFSQTLGDTSMEIGEINGANAGHGVLCIVDIVGYAITGLDNRRILGRCMSTQNANVLAIDTIGGWVNEVDVIDTINLFTSNVLTRFDVGTRAWLYGI